MTSICLMIWCFSDGSIGSCTEVTGEQSRRPVCLAARFGNLELDAQSYPVLIESELCADLLCERAHQVHSQAALGQGIKSLRKANAIIRYLNLNEPVGDPTAADADLTRDTSRVTVFDCVREQLAH